MTCISEMICDKCGKIYRCDSSKAGITEGNITYIWGPCACGYYCKDCYPNGIFTQNILSLDINDNPLSIYSNTSFVDKLLQELQLYKNTLLDIKATLEQYQYTYDFGPDEINSMLENIQCLLLKKTQ